MRVRWFCSPGQRSSVGNVKDLMRVEQLPEAVEELSALHAAALWVDEHQQGTDILSRRAVLKEQLYVYNEI